MELSGALRETHFMGAVLSAALSAMDIAMWDIWRNR